MKRLYNIGEAQAKMLIFVVIFKTNEMLYLFAHTYYPLQMHNFDIHNNL